LHNHSRKEFKDAEERNRDQLSNFLMPEARGTTGFTLKGMLLLLGILGLIGLFKYFFN